MPSLPDLQTRFDCRSRRQYSGEPVTPPEPALQATRLADTEGADDELVTAALRDDLPPFVAIPLLRGLISERAHRCVP